MSLKLRKLDLHVHTPASHDFADKAVTAAQIVEHAQKIGLDAMAVTDHNTVDFVDAARDAAKKKGFTIFPGIEISCGGSANGPIHIIALFDPSKTKDDLQKVLGKLDIKGAGEESFSPKGVQDVINIVRSAGGLPVLAHANSTHGALSDIKGNPRTDIVKNENLCAAEATAADFKKPKGKRLIDYLNGKDVVYERKLAVHRASDNRSPDDNGHCLKAIGSSFTYFKMGELTIESLRQCFEDPDSRVVQDYESEKINPGHAKIESMTISGGFLDGQTLTFNPSMNSIIGGTGTGKSLIVEFLRFAFDRRPQQALFGDHREKLEKQLRINGEVRVAFKDASGDEYELARKYDNPRNPYSSPITCTNKTTGDDFKGDVSSIFPLLIYSQNEILEITRDPKAQLTLLDNFRDFESHRNNVAKNAQDLGNLDRKLFQAAEDSANLESFVKQQATVDEKLKKLKRKLGSGTKKGTADQYLKLADEKVEIETQIEAYDSLLEKVDETISDFEDEAPAPKKAPKELRDIIEADVSGSYDGVVASLKERRQEIITAKRKSTASFVAWMKSNKFAQLERKYSNEIKRQEKKESFETGRKKLIADKKELDVQVENAKSAATRYTEIRAERSTLLQQLSTSKGAYFTERSAQAKLITDKSAGRLRLTVQQGDNKATYIKTLKKLKIGSHAVEKEIDDIVSRISPVDLVEMVLDRDAKKLAKLASLTEQKAESIISELYDPQNLQGTLAMQYEGYPEDRVDIAYQKKDGQYYPLSELSMGQKADALVMIALGDGGMPVIIDQPEDALDVPSIWLDICSKLRIDKHSRQFIFTTHNSSISVSSDSDLYVVLEADGVKGRVARSGSIDQQQIKNDVVDHLEGGYGSYDLKRKKYGL
ncbi:hypothetical protein A2880_02810 [Candidatus Peribacteria bacterium RIFCSPHIGHO2_01_FULL_49_38]|nr:MAG: hypothetical protein A2880_02810 [Candidatus Peribacteria bacterium RIFCSPHIGHO2_01_FULL_49_38]